MVVKCTNWIALDQLTRPELFCSRRKERQRLPPTSDALSLHVTRVHYQAIVWKQAHCTEPHLPDSETLGWKKITDSKLQPLLMTHLIRFRKPARKSSHSHTLRDIQISAAVARKQHCLVPVFVGANRTVSIYIPVNSVMYFTIEHDVCTIIDNKVIKLRFEFWRLFIGNRRHSLYILYEAKTHALSLSLGQMYKRVFHHRETSK